MLSLILLGLFVVWLWRISGSRPPNESRSEAVPDQHLSKKTPKRSRRKSSPNSVKQEPSRPTQEAGTRSTGPPPPYGSTSSSQIQQNPPEQIELDQAINALRNYHPQSFLNNFDASNHIRLLRVLPARKNDHTSPVKCQFLQPYSFSSQSLRSRSKYTALSYE